MVKRVLPYLVARFFDGISSGFYLMALPWLMLQTEGKSAFVALCALFCTLVSFAFTPLFSVWIDRHSRKKILVIVQVAQLLTAAGLVVLYSLSWGSHWALAASQLVFWVSNDVAWSTNNAFTQENYEKHEYAKISAYQEVIIQSTTLGAGALGVVLLERWSMLEFSLFAFVASTLSAVCYVLTPYNRRVKVSDKLPVEGLLASCKSMMTLKPCFYGILLISCLSYPVLSFLSKLLAIWFVQEQAPASFFAWYNIAFAMGSLMTGLLVSRILERAFPVVIMQCSMITLAAILLLMAIFNQPLTLIYLSFGYGLFNALNRIARTLWMHHQVDVEERGRVEGVLKMFSTLAQSLSYLLIAILAHFEGVEFGFLVAGLVLMLLSGWMLRLGSKMSRLASV